MSASYIGSTWEYKGTKYKIIAYTTLKHPESRKWIAAYVYENIEAELPGHYTYTRERIEFHERFLSVLRGNKWVSLKNQMT